ncbi:MAG: tRNA (cytidine(34)-2'-O)-methyltransferase [Blastocatellia bacterium]|nr:tRNA (cytidine(34)-2'-O)-methyltransferase [Blastocatellia bacterium]
MHIVLVEPEIPSNTGNISRTCACTGATLHLVGPLGFSTSDKYLRRAGLDYWHQLKIYEYDNLQQVWEKYPEGRFFYATTKAQKRYTEHHYLPGDFFVFGKETKGLPSDLISQNQETALRIPMTITNRSLNLSNAVAIVLYEALRQTGFHELD